MGDTMKALQITKENDHPTAVHLIQLPKPHATPGTILVKIRASAIQPSDLMNAQGKFPTTTFPRVPGRDYAGVVEEGGPPEMVGKEVYGTSGPALSFVRDGAHAEYCIVEEDAAAEKPRALSFKEAAAVGTSFTTASMVLERTHAKAEDVVLVIGSTGSVGSAAVGLARAMGCRVLTASRRDETDVNVVKDPKFSTAKDLTNGEGPDVVVDTVGDVKLMRAALDVMNVGGRFGYITAPRTGSTEIQIDIQSLYRRNISMIGSNSLTVPASVMAQKMEEMAGLFDSGKLAAPSVGRMKSITLEEAEQIYMGNSDVAHPIIEM
ncbi:MAG: hypothetical protein Q9227_001895 [Pyrenula ochraceoflavens]